MLGQYQTEPKAQNFLASEVRLCMGMADKIEVVTIAIDEKTILEITATIALPYSDQVWQPLSVLFVQSFCFACKTYSFFYFLFAVVFRFVFLSSVVALQRKTILDIRKFRWKVTIWWKTRVENDARRYPRIERLLKWQT